MYIYIYVFIYIMYIIYIYMYVCMIMMMYLYLSIGFYLIITSPISLEVGRSKKLHPEVTSPRGSRWSRSYTASHSAGAVAIKKQSRKSKIRPLFVLLLHAHIVFIQYNCLYTYYVRVINVFIFWVLLFTQEYWYPWVHCQVSFRHPVIGESKAGGYTRWFASMIDVWYIY